MRRRERSIADYDALITPLRQARAERSGKQTGDPAKAAVARLALVEAAEPPAHLLLGSDALTFVRTKLDSLKKDIDRWEALTRSTDVSS